MEKPFVKPQLKCPPVLELKVKLPPACCSVHYPLLMSEGSGKAFCEAKPLERRGSSDEKVHQKLQNFNGLG
jgi:hypothetical protein